MLSSNELIYWYLNEEHVVKYVLCNFRNDIFEKNKMKYWFVSSSYLICQYNKGMSKNKYGMLINNTVMIWYVKIIIVCYIIKSIGISIL